MGYSEERLGRYRESPGDVSKNDLPVLVSADWLVAPEGMACQCSGSGREGLIRQNGSL